MVADPRDANIAWLATWKGLARMDLAAGAATVVAEGQFRTVEAIGTRYIWANGQHTGGDGGTTLLWDLETAASLRVMTRDPARPDPLDPRRAIVRTRDGFELLDIASRQVLARMAFPDLPAGRFDVTSFEGRRTAWIECCGGLASVELAF